MKKFFAVALFSTFVTAPALADNSNTVYVAVDYGTLAMANAGTFQNPGALSLSAGYHFSPNWAVEGGYHMIGKTTTTNASGTQSSTYSQSMWSAAVVGTYPVTESFGVFGKLGLGMVTGELAVNDMFLGPSSSSASTSNMIYGFGAQYNISKQVGIRAQYESFGKTKADSASTGSDLTRVSAGLVYNF